MLLIGADLDSQAQALAAIKEAAVIVAETEAVEDEVFLQAAEAFIVRQRI